jgi:hypothetical protein
MSDKDEPKILSPTELEILLGLPILRMIAKEDAERHSISDLPPLDLGETVRPLSADDDLLAEMLESLQEEESKP